MIRYAALLSLFVAGSALAAPSVQGEWFTQDKNAVVTIAPCGSALCGRISKVLRPGPMRMDAKNPDPKLRGRPILGVTIISGMVADKEGWSGGRIYDPTSGKSYKSNLKFNPDGSLKVSGCIAFICQGQRWTRAR